MGSVTPNSSVIRQVGPFLTLSKNGGLKEGDVSQISGLVKESPYHHEDVDWNYYHRYRPHYPHSLWKLLDTYHDGPIRTIHDVGAGGGAGSVSLLQTLPGRIAHLIVSDPNPGNLNAAAKLLGRYIDVANTHLDFRPGNAEQSLQAPGEVVDMMMVCMALHWMNLPVLFDRVAESLRPGGTFMAVQYNPYPVIVNNPTANSRLQDFIDTGYSRVSKAALKDDVWAKAARQMSLGVRVADLLDDDERFEDVVRVEINTASQSWWFPPSLERALPDAPADDRLGGMSCSPLQKVEDYNDWGRSGVDLDWIRGFLSTLRGSSRAGFSTEILDQNVWRALAAEVDGPLRVCWQAYVILARRKPDE